MRPLERAVWLVNRAAAAIVGAALAGVLSGLGLAAAFAIACLGSTCEDRFGFPLYFSAEGAMAAVVLGSIPGLIALTLTPARARPWRALPILAPASALGFGAFIALAVRLPRLGEHLVPFYLLLLLFPTTTGLIAAFNINKFRLGKRRSLA